MSWPIDSQFQVVQSGVTRIGAGLLGNIQSGVSQLYGGQRSAVRLTVDGRGNAAALAGSGEIYAVGNIVSSGSVVGGQLVSSGNVTAGGAIAATGGFVVTGGGTAVIIASGGRTFVQQIVAKCTSSGAGLETAMSIPLTSGRAAFITARGIGMKNAVLSGATYEMVNYAWACLGSGLAGGHLIQLDSIVNPGAGFYSGTTVNRLGVGVTVSGSLGGGLTTSTTSGTILIKTGGSVDAVGLINWTVYADVTYSP